MKKLFLLLVTIIASNACLSQITLDSALTNRYSLIKLEKSGYKYYEFNQSAIVLLNLDFTVFKQFTIIYMAGTNPLAAEVLYITEALFDTDSTDIEYLLAYNNNNPVLHYTAVYDETGSQLFYAPNTYISLPAALGMPLSFYSPNYLFAPIQNTTLGTKLILTKDTVPYGCEIYNLPGTLPCNECSGSGIVNAVHQINSDKSNGLFMLSPNPFSKAISVNYDFPDSAYKGYIVVVDNLGNQVKKISVIGSSGTLQINCEELKTGMYLFELFSEKGFRSGKKVIKL